MCLWLILPVSVLTVTVLGWLRVWRRLCGSCSPHAGGMVRRSVAWERPLSGIRTSSNCGGCSPRSASASPAVIIPNGHWGDMEESIKTHLSVVVKKPMNSHWRMKRLVTIANGYSGLHGVSSAVWKMGLRIHNRYPQMFDNLFTWICLITGQNGSNLRTFPFVMEVTLLITRDDAPSQNV